MKNRACAFVVKDDKILMVEVYYYQRYFWTLPGGGIDKDETPEHAAIRELKEETGIDGEIVRPLVQKFCKDGHIEYTFLCKMKDENQEAITGYDPEELSAPEEVRQGIKLTAWKSFEELSDVDKRFLITYGYTEI